MRQKHEDITAISHTEVSIARANGDFKFENTKLRYANF